MTTTLLPGCMLLPGRFFRRQPLAFPILLASVLAMPGMAQEQVKTANGVIEGTEHDGIRSFKGIPFAAPPVGDLRWQAPQPPQNWSGVRKADKFGPRAMQLPIFGDMNFRSDGMAEDCAYLNVWTPTAPGKSKLPVLVYFYGGGFIAGDGSEPRYMRSHRRPHLACQYTVWLQPPMLRALILLQRLDPPPPPRLIGRGSAAGSL